MDNRPFIMTTESPATPTTHGEKPWPWNQLRPSSLPKLAVCPKYESDPIAGPAADRGTRMDAAFRAILAGEEVGLADADEMEVVVWAVQTTQILARGQAIITSEEELRVEGAGMTGTADGWIPSQNATLDLKSGEIRNYREQMAAYALGFMDRQFEDSWTTFLLFCDQRQVIRHDFTREEAESIVLGVKASVLDPEAVAQPCEYCDWCRLKYSCRKRLEGVAWWVGKDPASIDWDAELSDAIKLAQILDMFGIITKEGGLNDMARSRALQMLQNKIDVPGYTLRNRSGSEFVNPLNVGHHIQALGFDVILRAYGNLSAKKFREAWESKKPGEPLPEGIVETGPGSQFVAAKPKKKESPSQNQ